MPDIDPSHQRIGLGHHAKGCHRDQPDRDAEQHRVPGEHNKDQDDGGERCHKHKLAIGAHQQVRPRQRPMQPGPNEV